MTLVHIIGIVAAVVVIMVSILFHLYMNKLQAVAKRDGTSIFQVCFEVRQLQRCKICFERYAGLANDCACTNFGERLV